MTDRTESGRPVGKSGLSPARGGNFLLVAVIALITIGCAFGGYYFGLSLTYRDLAAAKERIGQLQPENQRLKKAIVDQSARLVEVQGALTNVTAAMQAIMPSENTYSVSPNQSLIVGGGRLTIGLIGSPPTTASPSISTASSRR